MLNCLQAIRKKLQQAQSEPWGSLFRTWFCWKRSSWRIQMENNCLSSPTSKCTFLKLLISLSPSSKTTRSALPKLFGIFVWQLPRYSTPLIESIKLQAKICQILTMKIATWKNFSASVQQGASLKSLWMDKTTRPKSTLAILFWSTLISDSTAFWMTQETQRIYWGCSGFTFKNSLSSRLTMTRCPQPICKATPFKSKLHT